MQQETLLMMHDANKHQHHGEKIKPFAKLFIALECPYATLSYNIRYLMGTKGSFLVALEPNTWTYYTNISTFVCSVISVMIGVLTDSYAKKYYVLLPGYGICLISTILLFITAVATLGPIEELINTVGLFWMLCYQAIEPVRIGLFFDQLPQKMEPHQAGHVFLMLQEMKTLGSVLYVAFNHYMGSNVYGETSLFHAVLYLAIPTLYVIALLSLFKFVNQGESSYGMGINCIMCFVHALHQKFIIREKLEGHWMDISRDAYDSRTVRNTKIMSSLIFIYCTLLSYGMTSILMKNSWTDQAKNLIEDLSIKRYYVDVNIIYFFLTIVFLPIIEYLLLPLWSKYRKALTELQRIGITMFFTGISFIATTIVQLEIEKYSSLMPSGGYAQVRIFNVCPYAVSVTADWNFPKTVIPSKGMIEAWNVISTGTSLFNVHISPIIHTNESQFNSTSYESIMATIEGESLSYLIGVDYLTKIKEEDPILFGPPGTNMPDKVRLYIINYTHHKLNVPILHPGVQIQFRSATNTENAISPIVGVRYVFQLHPDSYNIECRNIEFKCKQTTPVVLKPGGLYALLPFLTNQNKVEFKPYTIIQPAVISFSVMIPQIALLSFAEAMGKIPINLFIFKETPIETRTTSIALYYMSRDGTSIIFAIFHRIFRFQVDSFQLVLVTGIHMVFCFIFIYAAMRHQKFPEDDGHRRRRAMIKSI